MTLMVQGAFVFGTEALVQRWSWGRAKSRRSGGTWQRRWPGARKLEPAKTDKVFRSGTCRIQIAATQGGRKVTLLPENVAEHTAQQFERFAKTSAKSARPWTALRRRLDRISPDYAS